MKYPQSHKWADTIIGPYVYEVHTVYRAEDFTFWEVNLTWDHSTIEKALSFNQGLNDKVQARVHYYVEKYLHARADESQNWVTSQGAILWQRKDVVRLKKEIRRIVLIAKLEHIDEG